VRAQPESFTWQKSQPLADLMNKTAELERKLDDVRMSLASELAQGARSREAAPCQIHDTCTCAPEQLGDRPDADEMSAVFPAPRAPYDYGSADSYDYGSADPGGQEDPPEWRTEVLVNQGRHSSYHLRLSRGRKIAIGVAAVAVLVTVLVMALASGGASWPSSVATLQSEAARACQNPDVKSEPGQVNFACAKSTRRILWVFALMTSAGNPGFADTKTGRLGLEPIAPVQGGEVAWSLNLHHPYNPSNPIDSLEVAARAINNIIGGATIIGADGSPVVQPGLESDPANCVRYTGSAALTSHKGFPSLCARPMTSPAGQAAVVADVYQKWIVGAAPQAAQDAAVLFENANNPGDPRVQAILRHLLNSRPSA
jgi:hypothetical protein